MIIFAPTTSGSDMTEVRKTRLGAGREKVDGMLMHMC